MSGVGYARDVGKSRRPVPPAKPWVSGFCNPTNPDDSHGRCSGAYQDNPCACVCHRESEPTIAPGFHDDLDEATYHADRESLSHSGAKLMLKAPALYRYRLDNPERKDVFDFGQAAHAKVLGVGAETVTIDVDSKRGKAWSEPAEVARAEGKVPLTRDEAARIDAMADVLSEHRLAMRLLSDGKPEVSAYAVDEPTGIMRRGRFDWLGAAIVTDYKSAASSEPAAFCRAAANFGYHSQHAWYLDLAADLGHPAEAFAFIAQEKEPPYLVTVIELPPELVDVGRARNRRALERFRDCSESGLWPGYVSDDTFAQPPAPRWALYEEYAS